MRSCPFSIIAPLYWHSTLRAAAELQRANALVSHWRPGRDSERNPGRNSEWNLERNSLLSALESGSQSWLSEKCCLSPASWWQSFMETVANGSIQRMETKMNNFCCQNTAYLESVDPLETGRFSKCDSLLDSKELSKQLLDCFTDEELWTSGGGTETTLNIGFDGKFTTNNSKH